MLSSATFIAFSLALRVHELLNLSKEDFLDHRRIIIINNKGACNASTLARNSTPMRTEREITDDAVFEVLTRRLTIAQASPTGLLFPLSANLFRKMLKTAFQQMGLPACGLRYDGPHVLRHGGISWHLEKENSITPELLKRLNISRSTLTRYSTSQSSRLMRQARRSTPTSQGRKHFNLLPDAPI